MPRRRADRVLPPFVLSALLLCAAFTASRSSADELAPLLDLEWSAPAGCPTRDDVVARVDERVGASRPAGLKAIRARGGVTTSSAPTDPRFRLELVIGSDRDTRTLLGDDCSHLVDAAALILALDIDTQAHAQVDADAAAPAEEHDSDAAPSTVPSLFVVPVGTERRPSQPSPRRTHDDFDLYSGARLTVDEGSLPRTTLGLGPVLAVARGHFLLELEGIAFTERFTVAGPRRGQSGAYVDLSVVAAHGCWRGTALEVDWRGCIGGEIGRVATRGVNVAHSETATGFRSAASGMVGARLLPRSRVSPTAGFSVGFPLGAPPVFIEGFGTIFEPPSVVLRGFLGVDVNFL